MPKFAVNGLMPIDRPRLDGNSTAPLMRSNYMIPGLMEIQTPRADADAVLEVVIGVSINGGVLRLDGMPLTIDPTPES